MKHRETISVDVTAVEQVTPLIKQFTLRRLDREDLPPFSGGSHVVVIMPDHQGAFRNPYSLLSSPKDLSSYQIAVRREDGGRGGSLFMHQRVKPGSRLQITYPVNLFPLVKLARKHIFISGGVGITPILAMIDDLQGLPMPWELHYGIRGPEHDYFGRLLVDRDVAKVHLYYDSAGQELHFDKILENQPLGTHVYICGPGSMIHAVECAAKAAGWTDSHIHSEKFAAPTNGEPFDVILGRSNLTIHVSSECSLLEAMEAVGVEVPYLCRAGVCGQCETDVLELDGELFHNDHWLSVEERKSCRKIMPCVSRARSSRLVLNR